MTDTAPPPSDPTGPAGRNEPAGAPPDTLNEIGVLRRREIEARIVAPLLSCDRDGTMVEGFNDRMRFERTQTIMGGATHCDFRYTLEPPAETAVAAPGT